MNNAELDELLSAQPQPSADLQGALDDGLLLAWHRGELSEAEARAIESRLAADPEARALLAELVQALPADQIAWAEARVPGARPRRWTPRVIVGGGAALALAAGLTLFLLPGERALPPAYRIAAVGGGVQDRRGAGAPRGERFLPASRLVLTLHPVGEAPAHPPAVALYIAPPGERLRATSPRVDRGPTGVIRIELRAGDVFGERAGPWDVVIALTVEAPAGGLDGATLEQARASMTGTRWLVSRIQYALTGAEEEP